jgi:hypothetical protein
MKLELSRKFFENSETKNFMKILPLVAELFHANRRTGREDGRTDERTDMTKLMFAVRNFVKAP